MLNVNISYVGMYEYYMDFMQKMHEKNAFFMDKETSSDIGKTCQLHTKINV